MRVIIISEERERILRQYNYAKIPESISIGLIGASLAHYKDTSPTLWIAIVGIFILGYFLSIRISKQIKQLKFELLELEKNHISIIEEELKKTIPISDISKVSFLNKYDTKIPILQKIKTLFKSKRHNSLLRIQTLNKTYNFNIVIDSQYKSKQFQSVLATWSEKSEIQELNPIDLVY